MGKKRLVEIGLEWTFALPSAKWDKMHAALQQLKQREGRCSFVQLQEEDGVELGQLVNDQRQLQSKDKLLSDRQQRMTECGFKWVLASGTRDKAAHTLLFQFKKRKRHWHVEDGAKLGAWMIVNVDGRARAGCNGKKNTCC
jgi:hypothetical protein